MQYSRSLVIITGHSGAPIQPMVDRIASESNNHVTIKPVGSDKAFGFRAQDIENAITSGQAAVISALDPTSASVLQGWARREGVETHTVFIRAPQELSFSRAMGSWEQVKQGKAVDSMLPDIEPMGQRELLEAYERGEVTMIDQPHYRSEMAPKDMLRRFSAIIHSEPMWEDSVDFQQKIDFEPAFGPSLSDMAGTIVEHHADHALSQGYGSEDPAPRQTRDSEPKGPRNNPNLSM